MGGSLHAIRRGVSAGRFVALSVKILLQLVALGVHVLLHMTVLAVFMLVLFMSGLFVSTGVSLWRLIQHSYDKADGDPSKANMSPALLVLYTLVVAQGAVFSYTIILSKMDKRIAANVAKEYGFQGEDAQFVSGYMAESRGRSTEGRNLVTYAVGLMGCDKSPQEHTSGARLLGALLLLAPLNKLEGQHMLIRQLIGGSAPSSQTLQEYLLDMLNSSTWDARTRCCAARIVAHVADTIHLDKFPRGIQSILSLLETFEEYHNHALRHKPDDTDIPKEEDYREMLLQGLHIIWVLAADEENCKVISEARGVLPKIMAPLTCDLGEHSDWLDILTGSLRVMQQLTASPGESGAKVRRHMSHNKHAISCMIWLIKYGNNPALQICALEILTPLDLDTQSRHDFLVVLLHIFTDITSSGIVQALAGEKLAMLSSRGESNATIILQANGDVVDHLAALIVHTTDDTKFTNALKILENLCIHYPKHDEDEHLEKLKQAMTNIVMPKLLSIILPDEVNDHNNNSSSRNETKRLREKRKIGAALLSLFVTLCNTFISADQDLSLHFDTLYLLRMLKEIVARNNVPTASCLEIIKVACRMVIAMMTHRGSYPKQDMENLVEALCTASNSMILVDGSTAFSNGDESTTKHVRTLASLVQEAYELFRLSNEGKLQVMAPTSVGIPS